MGIDLGTSSLKVAIVDEGGKVCALCSSGYQYDTPAIGYAEQDPEVWWRACVQAVGEALVQSGLRASEITGIGFSGQMHGAVMLDGDGCAVRPVILHNDARSGRQVEELKQLFGADVQRLMMNPVYTGFLLPSLLWVRQNEPENYAKIRRVCLPKDYIKYKLTGEVSSDFSDASATLCFDIQKGEWSRDILKKAGLPESFFPPCYAPSQQVGVVGRAAAEQTGLCAGTAVVAGGGDQVMQGIGNGAIGLGTATANIGSSGQVCFQSDRPLANERLSTNTFCGYQKGRWIVMGAIMHAGLSLKWFGNMCGVNNYELLDKQAEKVPPGSGGVVFLPYLSGERTPHLNPDLSGMFLGCHTKTGRPEMARAVMEGVAFAMQQCMEVCCGMGLAADSVIASGGGAQSALWLQIQADVYGLPLRVAANKEQASLGAAIAAGVGTGVYGSVAQGCAAAVRYKKEIVQPNAERHRVYKEYYALYKEAYEANKILLERITRLGRNNT